MIEEDNKSIYIHFGKKSEVYEGHRNCTHCSPPKLNALQRAKAKLMGDEQRNAIHSSSYTVLTFLPLSLFNQFRRKANIYFTLMVILSFTSYSSKNNITAIIPLATVLFFAIAKDGYEFSQRNKEDKRENMSISKKYDPVTGTWSKIYRQDIKEGDILLIRKNEEIPADVLLIQTELNPGLCSIDTTNLDGESNLKIKRSFESVKFLETDNEEEDVENWKFVENLEGFIKTEPPNARMDRKGWKGGLYYRQQESEEISHAALDMSQYIMRGSVLKNTEWILGFVIFVGKDTKMLMQSKTSNNFLRNQNDIKLDRLVLTILSIELLVSIVGCIFNYFFYKSTNLWYFNSYTPSTANYFLFVFSMMIVLESAIPISLYVVIEVSKLVQSYNIVRDKEISDIKNNKRGIVRSTNTTDEFGQVSIIFSDKTGTLTRNKMVFSRCTIGGFKYIINDGSRCSELTSKLMANDEHCNEFLTLIALCHTVLVTYPQCEEKHTHSIHCNSEIAYDAESPDEKVLVEMAKSHKYVYQGRFYESMNLENNDYNIEILDCAIMGRNRQFKIYECIEFSSERKRMTVIVEDERDGKIKVYTKGADCVITKLLSQESRNDYLNETLSHMDEFACKGLRTIMCAYRVIERDEFERWFLTYQKTKLDFNNPDKLDELIAEMETDLVLLGATAVEDQLQEDVPDTLRSLTDAGIIFWILTGDQTQTTLNIVKSCHLLSEEMHFYPNLVVLDASEEKTDEVVLARTAELMERTWDLIKDKENNCANQAMVINGRVFGLLFPQLQIKTKHSKPIETSEHFDQKFYQDLFISLLLKSRVVICTRLSPFQKSQLLILYKSKVKKAVALAIGDGANDVPMLKSANVSVGIIGKEGSQASRAADVAVHNFKSLKPLVLYHGATNYVRICKLINFSFYKNISIISVMVTYLFFAGNSNILIMPQDSIALHNIFYTHVPIFVISIFDKPYTKKTAYSWPFLYKRGPKNKLFNVVVFLQYFTLAVVHGVVVLILHYFIFDQNFIGNDGYGLPICYISFSLFGSILAVITAQSFIECEKVTIYHLLSVIYTIPFWIVLTLSCNYFINLVEDNYGCFWRYLNQSTVWVAMLISLTICCLPQLIFKYFFSYNYPTKYHIVKELEKINYDKEISHTETPNVPIRLGRVDSTVGNSDFYPQKKKGAAAWSDFMRNKVINSLIRKRA